MDRSDQIKSIVEFVDRHPESLASEVIRRRTREESRDDARALAARLEALDDETLTGYYYLIR
ncbi:MAG: hypothetical protein ACM3XS_00765 [Bacteroidota bacterium]